MALGTPVAGAAAYSAQNGTSVAPAYPSGILATDAVILFVGQKPSTANGGTVTTPTGWTLRDELTGAGGYGTTLGADTGNTNLRVYSWNTPVAGQTGTRAVTLAQNNVSWAFIVRIPTGGGALSYGSADGQRTTTPTSPMSIALTNGATATNFQTGDVAIWAMCIPTDVTTPNQFSAQDITATGAVFGTPVELNEPDSQTGNDIGGYSAWDNVDSGSSTTAPTVITNITGTLTNVRGPIVLLRIREVPPDQTLTQGTTFTNTPQFFGPTANKSNTLTPALFTNTPQFFGPTLFTTVNPGLFTNTPQFFAATATSPVTLSQISFGSANLVTYSEQFNISASGWDKAGSINVGADVTTAPDGTTTADSITTNATTGFTYIRQYQPSARPLQIYTFSVYAKKNNYRYVGVRACNLAPGLGSPQEHCAFDFDTESFVFVPATSGILSTSWTNVGSGWYRLVVTAQVAANSTFNFRVASICVTDSEGREQPTTAPLGSSIYIWGAQLEIAATASAYIKTVATAPVVVPVPNVFYAATVTQSGGVQTLTPNLFTNTPQFFTATLTASNTLTAALYTNTPQFFTPTVGRGAVNLSPALYTNTPQFFTPTVGRGAVNLSPALYTNTPQFFTPTIDRGAVNLSPALYTNTPQFFTATITQGGATQGLTAALYTNTPQFFSATIAQPAQVLVSWFEIEAQSAGNISPNLYTNTPQFFAPTITTGAVNLSPALYTNSPQFFTPTVTLAGAPQTLTPALFTNTPQFFTPTVGRGAVNLSPALYTNNNVFFAHSLSLALAPALYTNTPQFFTPTIGRGAVNLSPALYTNTPQFFTPTVGRGAANIAPALFTNTPQFFTPTVATGQVLTQTATYVGSPVFYAPSISRTLTQTATYVNNNVFYAPRIDLGLVQANRYTNTPQFYGGDIIGDQALTFEDYVDSGYVTPGYVLYIADYYNVFFTGNLELSFAVTGLQTQGFVGTVSQNLASVVVPVGVSIETGIGYVNIWGLVDDTQNAGWTPINVEQIPSSWTQINDGQVAGWQPINVAQDPIWELVE